MSIYPDTKNGKLTGRFRVEVTVGGRRRRARVDSLAQAIERRTHATLCSRIVAMETRSLP